MRVIITGGRTYQGSPAAGAWLAAQLQEIDPVEILHGAAKGADTFAALFIQRNLQALYPRVRACVADWRKHGRGAGLRRNDRMAQEAGDYILLAFPGGPGTADMVETSRLLGKQVRAFVEPPA